MREGSKTTTQIQSEINELAAQSNISAAEWRRLRDLRPGLLADPSTTSASLGELDATMATLARENELQVARAKPLRVALTEAVAREEAEAAALRHQQGLDREAYYDRLVDEKFAPARDAFVAVLTELRAVRAEALGFGVDPGDVGHDTYIPGEWGTATVQDPQAAAMAAWQEQERVAMLERNRIAKEMAAQPREPRREVIATRPGDDQGAQVRTLSPDAEDAWYRARDARIAADKQRTKRSAA